MTTDEALEEIRTRTSATVHAGAVACKALRWIGIVLWIGVFLAGGLILTSGNSLLLRLEMAAIGVILLGGLLAWKARSP